MSMDWSTPKDVGIAVMTADVAEDDLSPATPVNGTHVLTFFAGEAGIAIEGTLDEFDEMVHQIRLELTAARSDANEGRTDVRV
ncbi:hypothetical protein SEA_OBLADI_158 [Gordonia phage ObLaDi]|uniref:Uncharacterized protein n=1 Tax=Gordonia phage ObLaDi TaxID=2978487 RepID=A0A977PSA0_9CAUD|nr:hypothetical protein SEA_OBLADI_158 [Gordonia phage ObLaDi]